MRVIPRWRKPGDVAIGLFALIFLGWSFEIGMSPPSTLLEVSPPTPTPTPISDIPGGSLSAAGVSKSPPVTSFSYLKGDDSWRATHLEQPYPQGISSLSVATAASISPPSWCSDTALNGPGQMSPAEISLLSRALLNASSYFEWGSGSSTVRALRMGGVRAVTVVDTSKAALACLLHHPAAAAFPRLRALFADIAGDDERAGNPKDRSLIQHWPGVSNAVLHYPDPLSLDVVLIDGRFRAAAAMKTASAVRDDTSILVHDWGRLKYHYAVKVGVLDVVETAGALALLRRGQGARSIDALEPAAALEAWKALWGPVEEDFE